MRGEWKGLYISEKFLILSQQSHLCYSLLNSCIPARSLPQHSEDLVEALLLRLPAHDCCFPMESKGSEMGQNHGQDPIL